MLGSWVLIDVFLQFNLLSCSLSQVFIYFPFLLSWGGFFESSGLFGLFIKEGQTALLVGFLVFKVCNKDKNEGHLFWNWNFTNITKSDPINNILQLTQLTLKLL